MQSVLLLRNTPAKRSIRGVIKSGARTADLPVRRNVLSSGAFVWLEALDDWCAAAGEDVRGPEEWFTIVTHSQSPHLVGFAAALQSDRNDLGLG